MNPQELSNFFQQYLGAKYTWWHEGMEVGKEAPFYSLPAGSKIPTVKEVSVTGINCAGLLNLGRLACGLDGCLGTPTYDKLFDWEPLPADGGLPAGVVLFRKYHDDEDQGHVAYMISDKKFIHSCDYNKEETGVCLSEYKYWKHYFTHWAPFEEVFSIAFSSKHQQ